MKFVILSPRQDGGGAIVLHCLCRQLQDLGIDAKIFYFSGESCQQKQSRINFLIHWLMFCVKDIIKFFIYHISKTGVIGSKIYFKDYFYEPVKNCKRKYLPFVSNDTIVVYPDIIYGNVLKAKNVVRWLLYFNRFSGDNEAYGKCDLFFCYREIFNDYKLNPECRTVCLQNFDFDLYKQTNFNERKDCCYIVRKGSNRADLPKKFNGPVIDNWTEEDKVKAFNKYKTCYFYDTQTFYSLIAAVCGCMPVVVLEPGKLKSDYLSKGEHPAGIAYGESDEEIEYAKKTRKDCINYLKTFDDTNKKSVNNFIDICKKYFNY